MLSKGVKTLACFDVLATHADVRRAELAINTIQ